MKRLLIPLLAALDLPTAVNGEHLKGPKELTVTSESTKESIALAKYLKNNGAVSYTHLTLPTKRIV